MRMDIVAVSRQEDAFALAHALRLDDEKWWLEFLFGLSRLSLRSVISCRNARIAIFLFRAFLFALVINLWLFC